MSICGNKGVARAKVRAANGKPSVLYNDLLKHFNNNRDEALNVYAKTQTSNFETLYNSATAQKDVNGEPLIADVIKIIGENYDLKIEPKAKEEATIENTASFSIRQTDVNEELFDDLFNSLEEEINKEDGSALSAEEVDALEKELLAKAGAKPNTNTDGKKSYRKRKQSPLPEGEEIADVIEVDDFKQDKERLKRYKETRKSILQDIENKASILEQKLKSLIRDKNNPTLKKEYRKLRDTINDLRVKEGSIFKIIQGLEDTMSVKALESLAFKELKGFKEELAKNDISLDKIVKYEKAILIWKEAVNNFSIQDESKDNAQILYKIQGKAQEVYSLYLDNLNRLTKEQVVRFSTNPGVNEDTYSTELDFKTKGDIWAVTSYGMALGRVSHTAFQIVDKVIRSAAARMSSRVQKFNKEVDKVAKSIKDWDMFAEKYRDGKPTGMLIHYISPEFREAENIFYDKLKRQGYDSEQKYQAILTWIKNNKIILDPRILFYDKTDENGNLVFNGVYSAKGEIGGTFTEEDRIAHIKEIVDLVGEKEFNRLKERAEAQVDEFVLAMEMFDENKPDANATPEELIEFQSTRHHYVNRISPFVAAYSISNLVAVDSIGDIFTINNKVKQLLYVPRKYELDSYGKNSNNDLGYYNEAFNTIKNNPELLKFHEFYVSRMNALIAMLPNHIRINKNDNYVAMIDKSFMDMVRSEDISFGEEANKSLMKIIARKKAPVSNIDPYTGNKSYTLSVEAGSVAEQEIKDALNLKLTLFKEANDREASVEEKAVMRREIVAEISNRKSFALDDLLKIMNYQVEEYMYKAGKEDMLKAVKHVTDSLRESKRDGRGNVREMNQAESYRNLKSMLDYYYDHFYGFGTNSETSDHKVYSKKDKAIREDLLKKIEDLKNRNINGEFDDNPMVYIERLSELTDRINELGYNLSWEQAGRSILSYVQLQGMGFNYGAALTNMMQGYITNLIESKDGRIFNTKQLFKAYAQMGGSVMSFYTGGHISTDTAHKVRNIMIKFDLLGETSTELSLKKSTKGTPWYKDFYVFQNSSEYINQAPVLIATLSNVKVTKITGDVKEQIPLWEALDVDGNLRTDIEIENRSEWDVADDSENSGEKYVNSILKVSQAISAIHGNYNKLTPTQMNKNAVLAGTKQFKTWLFESIAQRLEVEKYDEFLQMRRKGRWRSGFMVFTYAKRKDDEAKDTNFGEIVKNTLYTSGQLMRALAFMKTNFDGKFNEVDAANLRKNISETIMMARLTIFAVAIASIAKARDDDDENYSQASLNYSVNVANRLIDDLQLYYNAGAMQNIMKGIIPAFAVVTNLQNVIKGIYWLLTGKVTETGVYAGDSQGLRYLMKGLPFASKIHTTRAMSKQIMDNIR